MSYKNTEKFVQRLFKERYGVRLEKIPETSSKSPDFKFIYKDKQIAVAELKQLEHTPPSEINGWEIIQETEGIIEATRKDNAPSRVSDCIYKAYKQLIQYPIEPKILILLNMSPLIDIGDLEEACNGYTRYGNGRIQYLNHASRKIAFGKIKEIKNYIDLYIWIDQLHDLKTWFRYTNNIGEKLVYSYFALDNILKT